jgi:ABC-type multidrug transport system ATPase subunit
MGTPTVEVVGLRKAFGEVQALDGLSLAVPAGSVLGLLGPNGSGKTTTVSILATSLRPDAGRAAVGGEEADALADQVVIISAGRVAGTGTPAELKARFGTVLFHLDFGRQEAARAAHTALASAGYRPQRDGAGLQVRSTNGSGELPGMLRALGGRAPDPVSVAVREPTLDDVFLSLTGGGEAA